MDVIHFADTHIGVTTNGITDTATGMNSRVVDYLESIDVMIDYIEDIQADLVLFAGDAFHYHSPSPTYFAEFGERLRRISKICPFVAIPGNHDIAASRDASAMGVFDRISIPGVFATDSPKGFSIKVAGQLVYVGCVPYPIRDRYLTKEYLERFPNEDKVPLFMLAFTDMLERLEKEAEGHDVRFLLGHFTVSGCRYGSEQWIALGHESEVLLRDVAKDAWDYVALGHIHYFQDLNKDSHPPVVYSGSLDRIDFGEESEYKGFVHISIEDELTYQFIDVDARPMQTLSYDLRDEEYPNDALISKLKNEDVDPHAIVRLQIKVQHNSQIIDSEVRKLLEDRCFNIAQFNVQRERQKSVRLDVEDIGTIHPIELLDVYFQEQGIDDPEIDELLDLFEEIAEDVSE